MGGLCGLDAEALGQPERKAVMNPKARSAWMTFENMNLWWTLKHFFF